MSRVRNLTGLFLAAFLVLGMIWTGPFAEAAGPTDTYTIYPKPQQISYGDTAWVLRDLNVVYDDEVDDATKARFAEIAKLKDLGVTESDAAARGKTNVFVGVNGSAGPASAEITKSHAPDAGLFDHIDSYQLIAEDGGMNPCGWTVLM